MAYKYKYSIEYCEQYAAEHGFRCLETSYVSTGFPMKWECLTDGCIWTTKFSHIINKGSRCPDCHKRSRNTTEQFNINFCKAYAIEHGFECLSTEYKNNATPMKWKCSEGHEWDKKFYCIYFSETRCRKCRKYTIEECKAYADKHGFECLSNKYVGVNSKLTWKCQYDHEWEATFSKVKDRKHRCKKCKNSTGETSVFVTVRDFFPEVTEIVRNDRKILDGYELDIYLPKYNIALEYDGDQHHKYTKHFHRNGIKDFFEQIVKDKLKDMLCRNRDPEIILIRVNCNVTNIREYVLSRLMKCKDKYDFELPDKDALTGDKSFGTRVTRESSHVQRHIELVISKLNEIEFSLEEPFADCDRHKIKCNKCNTPMLKEYKYIRNSANKKDKSMLCRTCNPKKYGYDNEIIKCDIFDYGFNFIRFVDKVEKEKRRIVSNCYYCGKENNKPVSDMRITIENGEKKMSRGCTCWCTDNTKFRMEDKERILEAVNKITPKFTKQQIYQMYYDELPKHLMYEYHKYEYVQIFIQVSNKVLNILFPPSSTSSQLD